MNHGMNHTSPIVWDVAGIVPLTKKNRASSGLNSIRFLKFDIGYTCIIGYAITVIDYKL